LQNVGRGVPRPFGIEAHDHFEAAAQALAVVDLLGEPGRAGGLRQLSSVRPGRSAGHQMTDLAVPRWRSRDRSEGRLRSGAEAVDEGQLVRADADDASEAGSTSLGARAKLQTG
jgi:hypothetical protein